MSSSNSTLPPYSEIAASKEKSTPSAQIFTNHIAGIVQTCSIKDLQVDCFKIVRESPTSCHICLTVDFKPIYHIELVSDSNKVGDIQVFPAFDATLPVAAVRLLPKPKMEQPAAMICTFEPHRPDAVWRPMSRAHWLSAEDYASSIPVITVPGTAPTAHQFEWWTGLTTEPFFRLYWTGPLPFVPKSGFVSDQRGSEYIFASVARKTKEAGENLIEIRRGGGLDFELSVLVEVFAILHHRKIELL